MSLEAKIEALTEQVTQLTDAVTVLKNVLLKAKGEDKFYPNGHADGQTAKSADKSAVTEKATSSEAVTIEKSEDPNAKPSTTTDTSPPSSNGSRTVTYDDVKNVTIAVSKIDKAKAVAGLARFGVTTAKALNESQWLDYVVYMERVAKGEIDPESSHE